MALNFKHPSTSSKHMDAQSTAEKAVSVIGYGYDLCNDLRLTSCKPGLNGSRLIEINSSQTRDVAIPGGGNVVVKDVPCSIKCDKGDRTRFNSDILTFNQMSEKINQEMCLSGKIPCGLFNNSMFNYTGCWQKDASATKTLAFDGWFITLYNVELERSQISLSDSVKEDVPSSWDPPALAEFIEKYGTHVVVGVKMGGKDVVHVKQLKNSSLQQIEMQKLIKQLADRRFSDSSNSAEVTGKRKDEFAMPIYLQGSFSTPFRPPEITHSKNEDMVSVCVRKGGIDVGQSHNEWLSTISQLPNVISMSFVPITSLLSGVRGTGFLTHAVNLYLRYKPPMEELHQFFEFQIPRQWAPVYGDLPLSLRRKKEASPSLKFTIMGPRLYVNTTQVDSGGRPVTGLRLYLEGKKCDHLAIHLQHLSSLPQILQISDDPGHEPIDESVHRDYFEPVKWSIFSHVCTAPVQYNESHIDDDSAPIVTKAWFEVKVIGMKKILFLRLGYSMVASAKIRRSEWDGPSTLSRKSGVFSILMSGKLSTGLNPPEKHVKENINSAVYPGGPPLPQNVPKMTNFVDTKEMMRGPEDQPGYWVVTGAKLSIEGGKISIKLKYSLLTIMSEESMMLM
ncbi:hypothetical protein ACFE04_020283 [Oxalis oulophora]